MLPDPRGSHPHDREVLWGGTVLLLLPIQWFRIDASRGPPLITPVTSNPILSGAILLVAFLLDRAIGRLRKIEAEGGPNARPR